MNKTEALKRLSSLEEETKQLRKIIEEPVDIKDLVKSFEDACNITGDSRNLPFVNPNGKIQERCNYDYMLYIIAKALNEEWKLNWSNDSEYKWYPWMAYNKAASAFRFHFSHYYFGVAYAGSGVRLKNKDLSDYMGKQFEDLISKHLLTL